MVVVEHVHRGTYYLRGGVLKPKRRLLNLVFFGLGGEFSAIRFTAITSRTI